MPIYFVEVHKEIKETIAITQLAFNLAVQAPFRISNQFLPSLIQPCMDATVELRTEVICPITCFTFI